MAEYHVGCGCFGIYAGTLKPQNKNEWKDKTERKDKTECADEALKAVRDYMVMECLGGIDCTKAKAGGYAWTLKDGRTVELVVSVKNSEEDE